MFLDPPPTVAFSDQFAFRPTGSTSAVIISLFQPAAIQSVCRRHLTGLFQGVRHRPTLHAAVQAELDLLGSSIGPAAYTVTAADLRPLNPDNCYTAFCRRLAPPPRTTTCKTAGPGREEEGGKDVPLHLPHQLGVSFG